LVWVVWVALEVVSEVWEALVQAWEPEGRMDMECNNNLSVKPEDSSVSVRQHPHTLAQGPPWVDGILPHLV